MKRIATATCEGGLEDSKPPITGCLVTRALQTEVTLDSWLLA